MERIDLAYAAPIPVGHRVRIRWLTLPAEPGVFGRSEKSEPHQPWVQDLVTGIELAPDYLFSGGGSKRLGEVVSVAEQFQPDLQADRELVGVVRACRVVPLLWGEYSVQTHLWVEPE